MALVSCHDHDPSPLANPNGRLVRKLTSTSSGWGSVVGITCAWDRGRCYFIPSNPLPLFLGRLGYPSANRSLSRMCRTSERKRGVAEARITRASTPSSTPSPSSPSPPVLCLNTAPRHQSWVTRPGRTASDAMHVQTDTSIRGSVAVSETSTLVECRDSAHPLRITTVFQLTNPEFRDAVYREYLACSSPGQETDGQELDPDDRAWAYTSSRHAEPKATPHSSQNKSTWHIHLPRWLKRCAAPTPHDARGRRRWGGCHQ
ncbi:hypothetical protein HD554DRAFT_519914 [Boletus coccyginus]|nr:hypothetical protein HD554DRAFT_519914 [Boletus coccyginus]